MKTNQIHNLLLLVSILVCWIMPSSGWASVEVNGIFYELDATEHKAMVSSSEGTYSGAIVIPESILYNDAIYNVTSIDNCAFEGCTAMTSLTIPSSVSNIGYYAFFRCEGLTSLYIPNGVTSIGDRAFANCYNLNSIEVDLNNTKYDSRNNCNAIIETESNKLVAGCKNTVLPNGIITIGSSAFFGCTGLASIEIPSSVTSIENLAFYECSSLSSVIISSSVTTIGEDAFAYCSGIEVMKVGTGNETFDSRNNCNAIIETSTNTLIVGCKSTIIPSGVNTIGPSAFKGCGIISITIPNGVEIIEREAFRDCLGLNSVSISGSVVTIEECAFESCHNLESVELNNGLKTIRGRAFGNCLSLKSLTIPQSVITLGNADNTQGVFFSTWSLESIVVESGNSVFDSRDNCNAIIETSTNTLLYGCKNTVIPNSIETIGNGAFMRQNYLESIIIPEGVKRIGEDSFRECDNLQSITFPSTLQSIGNCAFIYNVNFRNCFSYLQAPIDLLQPLEFEYLYVLKGTRELYLQNEWWNRSANIIEMDGDEPSELDVLATGQCGDNLTYTIYSDMSMVISGTGAMWNYDWNNHINNDYYESIEKVIIEDGVTTIGNYAFVYSHNLSSVTIGNDVISIGYYAFYNLLNLSSVTIPNSVTSIGSSAFESCFGLTSVTIGNSVATIDYNAFNTCYRLLSLNIPSSVTYISSTAFAGCHNLSSIVVESGNTKYDSRDNCNAIIETATNQLIAACKNTIIPNSVTSIGSSAYAGCKDLTSITIPSSVTSIGNNAFADCSLLADITVPSSVTFIGSSAFIRTPWYNNQPDGLIYINNVAYEYKGEMPEGTDIAIRNGTVSISNRAFSRCTGLISVSIPNSVTSIGIESFLGCTSLTTMEIPYGVTSIGEYAFRNCTGLTSVTIPNSVNTIGYSAFEGCTGLTSICIPNSITSIRYSAFEGCTGLASVTIPSSVSYIEERAFQDCTSLHSIYVECAEPPTIDWQGAFENVDKSNCSLFIPRGSRSAYENAEYWNEFENIVECGENGEALDVLATGQCGDNATYTLYSDLLMVITGTGEMWNYSSSAQINDEFDYSIQKVIIEEGLTYIGDYAFWWSGLTSIEIPNSVIEIGRNAFAASSLTSIDIPNSVINIGWYAFSNCRDMTSVTISNSLTRIEKGVFDECTGLTSVTIPNNVTAINSEAFSGCTGLTSIEIPNSVISIDNSAFNGCSSLTSLFIPNSVKTIYYNSFSGCKSLSSIVVEVGNSSYDSRDNCNAIINSSTNTLIRGCINTVIPADVSSIGSTAFSGVSGLTSIEIPNSVTSIGSYAFDGCTGLTSLEIPNSVTSIFDDVFRNCSGLTSIKVDVNNTQYDSRSNSNAIIETSTNKLIVGCKNTIIPNSVTSIGQYAFTGCTGLTSVTIPNSVTEIGSSAFYGCTDLTSVAIPNSVTSIGWSTFSECSGLTTVTIPNSVTTIGNYAFYNCSALTSITCESETPVPISVRTFYNVNKSTCTLYVPYGSKSAYENAEYWNEFENIVEYGEEPDTDISTLDNAIYMEQVEGRIGGTKDIKVKMKNDFDVRGFQFTMELPEGTTINSWTLAQGRLPEGTTMNKVLADGTIEGNQINVGCALNDGMKTFTGNDGTIATVNVSFAEDMEEGSYPIYLTQNSISDASGQTQLVLSDIKATLVLEDYVTGDTNGDGMVLIGDVITILNYIIGSPSNNFNVKAADVNGDGMVLIGDVIAVLNIIVNH